MGTLFLNQLKRQASSFLQDKYRTARLVLTDVTQAELLAEEATNTDPWGPDARTMTRIAEASFDIDDYWRIVDVLHRRFYSIDWKQWRQSYKSLVLLDFLLTHGPEDFAEEFHCDADIIEELGKFIHIDEKGFDWGINMQKKSERVLDLLKGGKTLKAARLKALKITNEIQGFGSPTSSSPSSSTSKSSITSSFGSFSTTSSAWNGEIDHELNKHEGQYTPTKEAIQNYSQGGIQDDHKPSTDFPITNNVDEGLHLWNCPPIEESGSLLDPEDEEDGKTDSIVTGICSKLASISPRCHGEKANFKSISDVGRVMKKKFDRQFSMGY